MAKTPKKFLVFSLIFFVIGFADIHGAIFWGISKPVGAVLFVLFMITHLMSDEMAKYDDECQSKLRVHRKRKPTKKAA